MVPNLSEWTIVTVGQWNPHIFSPQWIGNQLFHVQTVETELAVGPALTNVRYHTPNLILIPGGDRLIVGLKNLEDTSLNSMEQVVRNALQLLTHTPVSALGINFGFIENDPPHDVLQVFDLSDSGILGDAGYEMQNISVTRQIVKESIMFILKMTYENGKVRFHFNFNHPIASAEEGVRLLQGRVLECRDIAMALLTTVFHLERQEVA
ncbi:MAG: hypothetical protein NW701_17385 [Nitrospira sp.]